MKESNSHIENQRVQVRKAHIEDFDFYYRMKCEPINIRWSGHNKEPDRKVLCDWFAKQLESNVRTILICTVNESPVGYAYIDDYGEFLEISIAIAGNMQGLGYGKALVRLTKEYCIARCDSKPLHAFILSDNIASIKAFQADGYRRMDSQKEVVFDDGTVHQLDLYALKDNA